jgi:hypothetical protein
VLDSLQCKYHLLQGALAAVAVGESRHVCEQADLCAACHYVTYDHGNYDSDWIEGLADRSSRQHVCLPAELGGGVKQTLCGNSVRQP